MKSSMRYREQNKKSNRTSTKNMIYNTAHLQIRCNTRTRKTPTTTKILRTKNITCLVRCNYKCITKDNNWIHPMYGTLLLLDALLTLTFKLNQHINNICKNVNWPWTFISKTDQQRPNHLLLIQHLLRTLPQLALDTLCTQYEYHTHALHPYRYRQSNPKINCTANNSRSSKTTKIQFLTQIDRFD